MTITKHVNPKMAFLKNVLGKNFRKNEKIMAS